MGYRLGFSFYNSNKVIQMEKRHLFERELQQEALQEFDALASRSWWTGRHFARAWKLAFGTGGASRRRGRPCWDALVMFRAAVGCDAWIE